MKNEPIASKNWHDKYPNYKKLRKRVYWALNFYHFVNDAIVFLIPTLMATFYEEFGLDFWQTSMVLAFNLGATVLFQVFNGYLVDRGKEKFLYLFGLPFMTSSVFLLLLAEDFISLLLLATLNGVGLSYVHAIVYSIGLKLYSGRKEQNQSNMAAFGDLGKILSIISSAILISLSPKGWRSSLILWGVIAAIIYFSALFIIPKFPFEDLNRNLNEENESPQNQHKTSSNQDESLSKRHKISSNLHENTLNNLPNSEKRSLGSKSKRRIILLLYLAFFVYTASNEVIIKTYTVFFRVHRDGLSSEFSEFLYVIYIISGTIGVYLSGRFKAKWGFRKLLNRLYMGQIPTLLLFILLDIDMFIFDIIFSVSLGFFLVSVYISIQSEIAYYVSFKKIGVGYAGLLSFGWMGGFIFQLISGYLADRLGEMIIFIISLILACIVILIVHLIPKRAKDESN